MQRPNWAGRGGRLHHCIIGGRHVCMAIEVVGGGGWTGVPRCCHPPCFFGTVAAEPPAPSRGGRMGEGGLARERGGPRYLGGSFSRPGHALQSDLRQQLCMPLTAEGRLAAAAGRRRKKTALGAGHAARQSIPIRCVSRSKSIILCAKPFAWLLRCPCSLILAPGRHRRPASTRQHSSGALH